VYAGQGVARSGGRQRSRGSLGVGRGWVLAGQVSRVDMDNPFNSLYELAR